MGLLSRQLRRFVKSVESWNHDTTKKPDLQHMECHVLSGHLIIRSPNGRVVMSSSQELSASRSFELLTLFPYKPFAFLPMHPFSSLYISSQPNILELIISRATTALSWVSTDTLDRAELAVRPWDRF